MTTATETDAATYIENLRREGEMTLRKIEEQARQAKVSEAEERAASWRALKEAFAKFCEFRSDEPATMPETFSNNTITARLICTPYEHALFCVWFLRQYTAAGIVWAQTYRTENDFIHVGLDYAREGGRFLPSRFVQIANLALAVAICAQEETKIQTMIDQERIQSVKP